LHNSTQLFKTIQHYTKHCTILHNFTNKQDTQKTINFYNTLHKLHTTFYQTLQIKLYNIQNYIKFSNLDNTLRKLLKVLQNSTHIYTTLQTLQNLFLTNNATRLYTTLHNFTQLLHNFTNKETTLHNCVQNTNYTRLYTTFTQLHNTQLYNTLTHITCQTYQISQNFAARLYQTLQNYI